MFGWTGPGRGLLDGVDGKGIPLGPAVESGPVCREHEVCGGAWAVVDEFSGPGLLRDDDNGPALVGAGVANGDVRPPWFDAQGVGVHVGVEQGGSDEVPVEVVVFDASVGALAVEEQLDLLVGPGSKGRAQLWEVMGEVDGGFEGVGVAVHGLAFPGDAMLAGDGEGGVGGGGFELTEPGGVDEAVDTCSLRVEQDPAEQVAPVVVGARVEHFEREGIERADEQSVGVAAVLEDAFVHGGQRFGPLVGPAGPFGLAAPVDRECVSFGESGDDFVSMVSQFAAAFENGVPGVVESEDGQSVGGGEHALDDGVCDGCGGVGVGCLRALEGESGGGLQDVADFFASGAGEGHAGSGVRGVLGLLDDGVEQGVHAVGRSGEGGAFVEAEEAVFDVFAGAEDAEVVIGGGGGSGSGVGGAGQAGIVGKLLLGEEDALDDGQLVGAEHPCGEPEEAVVVGGDVVVVPLGLFAALRNKICWGHGAEGRFEGMIGPDFGLLSQSGVDSGGFEGLLVGQKSIAFANDLVAEGSLGLGLVGPLVAESEAVEQRHAECGHGEDEP